MFNNLFELQFVGRVLFHSAFYAMKAPPTQENVYIRVLSFFPVDLRASGHSRKPIVVDTTPPIAGEVFDGPHKRKDWKFQSSAVELCASWDGFYDEQSGISKSSIMMDSMMNRVLEVSLQ